MEVTIIDHIRNYDKRFRLTWQPSGACYGLRNCNICPFKHQQCAPFVTAVASNVAKQQPLPYTIDTNDYPELCI